MIDFLAACEKARKEFVNKQYKNGIAEICDLGDCWLFFGRMFDSGITDYGNVPITIQKESGKCEDYQLSIIDNLKKYYKSDNIVVPTKYMIN